MTVYVLLFRGVGGKTQLPVARLRAELDALGYQGVGTYINSGNAYLKTNESKRELLSRVQELCSRKFGYDKDIYAVSLAEMRKLVRDNPFESTANLTPRYLHAAVLAEVPALADVERVRALAASGEGLEVVGRVAYLCTPSGFGTSKMAEKFDKWIGVANTARNWNTVRKLLELAEGAARGAPA